MRKLYPDLYAEYDRRNAMPCASCGRRAGRTNVQSEQVNRINRNVQEGTYVLLEYVGSSYGAITYWGACTGTPYKAGLSSAYRLVFVAPCDVAAFVESGEFRYVQKNQSSGEGGDTPTKSTETTAEQKAGGEQQIADEQQVADADNIQTRTVKRRGRRKAVVDADSSGAGSV